MYNPNLHFHFTGIGGSGMSGIAEVLLNLGFRVSGSDLARSATTARLEQSGAKLSIGHCANNLASDTSLLVYSSAVSQENPEVVEAKTRQIPVVSRAAVLAELMRLKFGVAVAGSHGKTTTTSMLGAIMVHGGLDPTVIIGGQIRSTTPNSESGGRLGRSAYLVAESDESDRSFLLLKPTIAIVTNIDSEHMNAYASLLDLEQSFESFVNAVPFYGLAVLCIDDPRVRDLFGRYPGRKVSYGLSPDAQLRAEGIELHRMQSSYTVVRGDESLGRVDLPMPGRHLVVNSLAAIAVGLEFGIHISTIISALASFTGVRRRSEIVGEVNGITVINDYAHHPTEIRATLQAIREGFGREIKIHVAFQPHRYSRTLECFTRYLDAFTDCDSLLLTEIYSAGEPALESVSGRSLFEAITHPNKIFAESLDNVISNMGEIAQPTDIVVFLGAGSIGTLPERFLSLIRGLCG